MSKKFNLYIGKAGQFTVMSEFLARGWNVAIPEVDVGDDIFVVKDENGEFARVQVKTATGIIRAEGYSAQFSLNTEQLRRQFIPELTYIFIVRLQNQWKKPLVIRREELFDLMKAGHTGLQTKDSVVFYFSFQNDKVICSGKDFSEFLDNFDDFPLIEH